MSETGDGWDHERLRRIIRTRIGEITADDEFYMDLFLEATSEEEAERILA